VLKIDKRLLLSLLIVFLTGSLALAKSLDSQPKELILSGELWQVNPKQKTVVFLIQKALPNAPECQGKVTFKAPAQIISKLKGREELFFSFKINKPTCKRKPQIIWIGEEE